MHEKKAFTLLELLVVIMIVIMIIVLLIPMILLPALGAVRRNANMRRNSTQVHTIIHGMLTFANDNEEFLPGRKKGLAHPGLAPGEVDAADIKYSDTSGHFVNSRYALLLEGAYFGAGIMLSPGDGRDDRWMGGNVRDSQFSYSMLEIDAGGGRRKIWDGGSISAKSPIMADRLTGPHQSPKGSKSYWSSGKNWRGTVGYGDGHTDFEDDQILQDTRYANLTCDSDDIFMDGEYIFRSIVGGGDKWSRLRRPEQCPHDPAQQERNWCPTPVAMEMMPMSMPSARSSAAPLWRSPCAWIRLSMPAFSALRLSIALT